MTSRLYGYSITKAKIVLLYDLLLHSVDQKVKRSFICPLTIVLPVSGR
jgi:hypothetical protein